MTASVKPPAASRPVSRVSVSGRTGGGSRSTHGARQGINDYTGWFAGDKEMAGDYYGYDGPCPPWNDAIVHHYIFTLYALDVASLSVEGKFTGNDVRNAMRSHMLAAAKVTSRYTLNPAVRM